MSGATDLRPPRAGDTSLSTLMPPGGDEALALHDWPLPADTPARGTVLLVHGLGEHAGRYVQVAARLNEWGFSVRGYDQYGHGESSGVRGSLSSEGRLLEDLATVIDDTRSRLDDRQPLILLGHSMGGLVAARLVSLRLRRVEGLVLSSPALDAGLSLGQKALLATLYRLAPDARVGNGLDTRYLSHDSAVIRAYEADPLVHDRVSARLAHFIATAGPQVLARAALEGADAAALCRSGPHRQPAGQRGFRARGAGGVRDHPGFPHALPRAVQRTGARQRVPGAARLARRPLSADGPARVALRAAGAVVRQRMPWPAYAAAPATAAPRR